MISVGAVVVGVNWSSGTRGGVVVSVVSEAVVSGAVGSGSSDGICDGCDGVELCSEAVVVVAERDGSDGRLGAGGVDNGSDGVGSDTDDPLASDTGESNTTRCSGTGGSGASSATAIAAKREGKKKKRKGVNEKVHTTS